ncbi:MAG: c-type cytochrome [Chitinophagaceae bacterium]
MLSRKHLATLLVLALLVTAGAAAVSPSRRTHKNLKVLPQDISDPMLDSIMISYNKALGVNCDFCHVQATGLPDSLDYASDRNHMKENAREMMRMTILINKTYFYYDKTQRPEYLNVVNCMTCHRGTAYPVE